MGSPPTRRRWLAGTLLHAAALALLLTALLTPWWAYSLHTETQILGVTTETDLQIDYDLREVVIHGHFAENPFSNVQTYEEIGGETQAVMQNAALLATIAVGLAVVALVGTLLSGLRIVRPAVGQALGLVAFGTILAAALFYFLAWPGAVESSFADLSGLPGIEGLTPTGFYGSTTSSLPAISLEARWGPGLAWILLLTGAALALLGTVSLRRR